MSFDDLPPQTAFVSEGAKNYSAWTMAESRKAQQSTRCVIDIPYGTDYYQKIDIYLPQDKAPKNLPVLMFLHGGGWQRGYKEGMGFMAPPIVSLPAIFVSVSYRLAREALHPQLLEDTVASVELVWRKIAEHGGSPDKITIGGHSAGGHLAALAAVQPKLFTARGVPADVIKYCFPVSGSYRFDPADTERIQSFMRGPEQAEDASPITHIRGNKVPFYITMGDVDFPHVLKSFEPMVEALKKEGSPVDSAIFSGMDHFHTNMAQGNPENTWVKKVRQVLAAL